MNDKTVTLPPSFPVAPPGGSAAPPMIESAVERAAVPARDLALRFNGSSAEYFRIWIVNLCLTLITLGIFSAWAKVRKKRYLYSHTVLDGTPFQYLGQPLPILKGRLIGVTLFGTWYAATHYMTALIPAVLVAAFVLAPWVMVRSAAFNARYSAWRNMTFRFAGSYWGAVKVLYGWLIVTAVTFGFAFSWWQQRIKRFIVNQTSYGGVGGAFSAQGGQFFRTYLVTGLLVGLVGGVVGGISFALLGLKSQLSGAEMDKSTPFIVFSIVTYAVYAVGYVHMHTRIANLVWNHTQLGVLRFDSRLRTRGMLWLYVSNAIAILASLGLLIPWATIRTIKYRIDCLSVAADGDLREFEGRPDSNVQAAGAEVGEIFDFDMSL